MRDTFEFFLGFSDLVINYDDLYAVYKIYFKMRTK